MADRYQKFTSGAVGGFAARRLGLPRPEPLSRFIPGEPTVSGPVESAGAGRLGKQLAAVFEAVGAEVPGSSVSSPGALVFDATAITDAAQLHQLYEFFHPRIRTLRPCGRILIIRSTWPRRSRSWPRPAARVSMVRRCVSAGNL